LPSAQVIVPERLSAALEPLQPMGREQEPKWLEKMKQ